MIEWNLRQAAIFRGVHTAAELRRRLTEVGCDVSAAKASALWSGRPERVKLADLESLCAALGCGINDLLCRDHPNDPDDAAGLPPPLTMTDAAGATRRLAFRVSRFPNGIMLWLSEEDPGPFAYPENGYAFHAWADTDADLGVMAAALTKHAYTELGHRSVHQHPDEGHGRWTCTEQVRGRFAFEEHGVPHAVVIDGHRLSWAELGKALESEEGECFRLLLEPSLLDLSTPSRTARPARRDAAPPAG